MALTKPYRPWLFKNHRQGSKRQAGLASGRGWRFMQLNLRTGLPEAKRRLWQHPAHSRGRVAKSSHTGAVESTTELSSVQPV